MFCRLGVALALLFAILMVVVDLRLVNGDEEEGIRAENDEIDNDSEEEVGDAAAEIAGKCQSALSLKNALLPKEYSC
jgi:hypothetical protein